MKVFLTGGTGFIGSYVLKKLIDSNYEVKALSRIGSKTKINLYGHEPQWLFKNLNEIKEEDLFGIDIVIHLATAGVTPQIATWEELVEVNVLSGIKLMQKSLKASVKRFICSGSAFEYGFNHNFEKIPPDAPLNPPNPYAASKVAGFQLMKSFAEFENIEFFYGRIFTAYGEGQYSKNLWPSLKKAALNNLDFIINSGNEIRDFIPVEKVADHICAAIKRKDIIYRQPKIINIGSGEATTIGDFAKAEWSKFNTLGRLKFLEKATTTPEKSNLVADIQNLYFT